ncbi:MAG: T9SS type A sorting domain-containing protein [Saprospiraceae bacterium]
MKRPLLLLVFALHFANIYAASFYVSTNATASGNGSFDKPWQLQTALNHPAALHPGDTVWIKGGVYTNAFDAQTSFSCYTHGTADAPIVFRNYKDESVTLDGQLLYSLYIGLGNCSYTWFWGLEITNSGSVDRNHNIPGGITCTAEHIKFINMIVHDTGSGLDVWKTAKNSEIYGCLVYHIGNNLNNNGNLEGHGHGMYLQNDTFGTKKIHNNIIFSNYGNGIKVWQTTTTAALGNFDIQHNIVFNGGSASENLGGVGNNSRTHNFFVVANGVNNPVVNTVIKHNYTYSGINTPRPPVNAFGLNYGVKNMILDSNYLTCQTRLGFNNTPIFEASVKDNKIIGGIPPVYGVYLWGFTQPDFPQNTYIPNIPTTGLEYFVTPNKYEKGHAHIVVYNWDSLETVQIDISNIGLSPGDQYELINTMDYFNDITIGTYDAGGIISVPMTGHSFTQAIGSNKAPVSQFPTFGAFVIRKKFMQNPSGVSETSGSNTLLITPNPSAGKFTISGFENITSIVVFNMLGARVYDLRRITAQIPFEIDLSACSKGVYFLRKEEKGIYETYKIVIQ